jgi:GNAT superfamily N-acetyltransferase
MIPPYTVLLKDGETTATIYPIYNAEQLPPGLLAFLADEFNMEIERGDTFPFFETLDIEEFKTYWFGSFAAVMVLGDDEQLDHQRQWEKECLGTFFIRNNFPGRSSHICTGGFLVNAGIRGKGIGKTLVECFLDWAPKLGYTSSIFNLVFEPNVGARKIFEALNFKRIGKIKSAGILKDHESAVDAFIYGKEFVTAVEPAHGTYRFDKIKYYLETGKYPPLIDRQEKSRLRSSASHYKLIEGKLTLKGREVVGDPVRQLEICTEYHRMSHGGINKTTSAITERYHWSRIKDTVAHAIRNCNDCRDPTKTTKKKKESSPHELSKTHKTSSAGDLISSDSAQEYHSLVDATSHLHRSDTSLLQADLTNLDDPSGILAAVEDAQRRQLQQQQQHHTPHSTQPTPGSQQQTYASALQSKDTPKFRHYDEQAHQQQQQRLRQFSAQASYAHNHSDSEDIPVDPEVSAFDAQGQSGEEIEIARALIQANEGTEGQNDEDIFR